MSRAVATFTVAALDIRVRVRILARERDVHAAFLAEGGKCARGNPARAFFAPATAGAKICGTIVLPLDGVLEELVPHESAHAVFHASKGVHVDHDEGAATAIGLLTARIHARIRKLGAK